MTMVVGCAAYEDGRRVADFSIDDVPKFRRGKGRFIWIGLHEPSEELLRKVQSLFGLHDLAIEDAHNAHQRPKLEVYGSSLFLVRDGRISRIPADIGIKSVERVEVLSGLEPGDRVVISPVGNMPDGKQVRSSYLDPVIAAGLNKPAVASSGFKGFK